MGKLLIASFNEAAAITLRKRSQPVDLMCHQADACFNEAAAITLRKLVISKFETLTLPGFNEAAAITLRKP